MLLLRFVLVMMLSFGSQAEDGKTNPSNCDTMACFTSPRCKDKSSTSSDLEHIKNHAVLPDCDAVAKIRSYSTKYYLIVLESYDTRVQWIQLEQGETVLKCEKDPAGKVSITYKYNAAAAAKEISENVKVVSDKLMCEFFVRNDAGDVFESLQSSTSYVYLKSSFESSPGSTMDGVIFHRHSKPTCDPDTVQTNQVGEVGDKVVSKVDVQFADLVCPAGQALTFRKDAASNFESAPKITCTATQSNTFDFVPALEKARCEVTICKMCETQPFPSALVKYTEAGCDKLKCASGRIRIGSLPPLDGSVECKYVAPNHVWQFNGEAITGSSAVSCAEKLTCDAEAKELCSECDLSKVDGIPTCPGGKLMWKTEKVTITCDDRTGKLEIKIPSTPTIKPYDKSSLPEPIIKCVGGTSNAAKSAANEKQPSTGGDTLVIVLGIVLGVICVVGCVGGGFFYFRRAQKKKNANQLPQTVRPDTKSVTSKKDAKKPTDPKNDVPKSNDAERGIPVIPCEQKIQDEERAEFGKKVEEYGSRRMEKKMWDGEEDSRPDAWMEDTLAQVDATGGGWKLEKM